MQSRPTNICIICRKHAATQKIIYQNDNWWMVPGSSLCFSCAVKAVLRAREREVLKHTSAIVAEFEGSLDLKRVVSLCNKINTTCSADLYLSNTPRIL